MNNIPLYDYFGLCSSILLLMDIWLVFNLGLLWIQLLWKFLHKSYCTHMSSFLLSVCLGIELLCLRVETCFLFIKNWQTFPQNGSAMLQPSYNVWSSCSACSKKFIGFAFSHLSRYKMASYYRLKNVVLMANDMKNNFICWLDISISF